ncbi:MAG: substrate-binding domain-containing protein [Pseudarcicella sp.]|nr:substrate-binding domain-containing protein [Pseudarcicella sp.]
MMNNFNSLKVKSLFVLATLFFGGCESKQAKKNADSYFEGEITVVVDKAFRPIMEAERDAFMNTYPKSKINLKFTNEATAVADILNDSARMAIISRDLTDAEQQVFTKTDIRYRSFKFVGDALALITHSNNPVKSFHVNKMKDLMNGNITKWSQLSPNGNSGKVTLVFDDANGSNLNYLLKKFDIKERNNLPFFAVKSNEEVVEFVKKNPFSMGVIGVNWISDGDDPASIGFIKDINVLGLTEKDNPTVDDIFEPFGYNLALKRYPLRRDVKIILKEGYGGLGTGFANYMISHVGQLVAQKGGLLPMAKPIEIRTVELPK